MAKYEPIFLGLTGSRLYGTNRPDSDWDFRGVVLGTPASYLGMLETFENTSNLDLIKPPKEFDWARLDGQDNEFYEVGKYICLAWQANPNILELLFCNNLIEHPLWTLIQEHRHLFLSKKCLHTFSGYAASQFKRMRNHHRWAKGEIKKPDREAMGLPTTNKVLSADLLKHLVSVSKTDMEFLFPDDERREMVRKELLYQELKREWKTYQKWLQERNPARATLEKRYGYDTKHATHLFRLFYECKHLLEQGELIFPLPEANELKDILHGALTYDQLIEFAEQIDPTLQSIAEKSELPREPDRLALDALIQTIRKTVIL